MATPSNNENAPPKGRKMSITVHTLAGDTATPSPDGTPASNTHLVARTASQRRNEKAKSLTQAELAGQVISDAQVVEMNTKLQTEEPPLSLPEARQRAASIEANNKVVRKNSVSFIRNRTSSRAAALGMPDPNAQSSPRKGGGFPRPVFENE